MFEEKSSKKKGFAVLAAIGGAAVVVIVAAVVIFSSLLSGPKGDLTKAVTKSVSAFQTASQSAGMPDIRELTKDRKTTQSLSLSIQDISGDLNYFYPQLSLLEGLGISISEGLNLPERRMDASFAVTYNSADVLSAWMTVDDETAAVGSPDFLGGSVYGFNTETLGRDLAALGGVSEETASISFNIFDTLETFSRTVEVDKSAFRDLSDAIEVEKSGKSAMDINGCSVNCTAYRVTVPQDALLTCLSAVEEAYGAREADGAFLDLLASLGMSSADLAEFRDALSGRETFDALAGMVRTAGDLELDVYISDGYVMAVEWADTIDGESVSLSAYLGGGKSYADDWSAELRRDNERLTITSTGDHSAAGGTYTDETSLTISAVRSGDRIKITSNTSWTPKASGENFQWSIKTSGVTLTAAGRLTAGKDSMDLTLDKLAVNALGTDLVTLRAGYAIRPYAAPSYSDKAPVMLAEMDENDVAELYQDVILNTQEWVLGLGGKIPGLYELFW